MGFLLRKRGYTSGLSSVDLHTIEAQLAGDVAARRPITRTLSTPPIHNVSSDVASSSATRQLIATSVATVSQCAYVDQPMTGGRTQ